MKKVIAVISMVVAVTILSSCSVRLSEDEKDKEYYNTILGGGFTTHNSLVIYNQNEKILENQEKILANQEKILQYLEANQ